MHGDGGIRTLDPHVANVVLSQLSYAPLNGAAFYRTDQIIIHQNSRSCKQFLWSGAIRRILVKWNN